MFIIFFYPWSNFNNPQNRTIHTDLTQLIFRSFTFYNLPPPPPPKSPLLECIRHISIHNFIKLHSMALVPLPPVKGACPPCWYYPLSYRDAYEVRMVSTGTGSVPNFAKIWSTGTKMNGWPHTEGAFVKVCLPLRKERDHVLLHHVFHVSMSVA